MSNNSNINFDVCEVGKVSSVRQFIITVTGLISCINGQIVEFEKGGTGLVMGFVEDEAHILILGSNMSLRAGDEVYNRAKSLLLPAGEKFVGRIINSLCEPVDNLGPIEANGEYSVFAEALGVMERIPVDDTLETGTLAIDAIIPIAKGQRQLLIGDRLSGKTSVAIDAMLSQRGKGVICIYCCTGKPYASFLKTVNLIKDKGILEYSILVSSVSSVSVGEQYLAPYTAAMLGEYFMKNGKDVLVIFDDLTKHAWTYRQISLLLGRAPGREAYPGDIFYIHSQLVERAGYLKPELKGGSMTFLPIIETLQGDLTSYIPTNMISMTDGQIYFNSELFYKGIKPAVDFGLSVSRIGNKAQWPIMRKLSKNVRLDYLRYQELLKMTRLRASGLSQEAKSRLKRGETITHLIVQDKNKPVSMEEQIIYLHALNLGVLDVLSQQEVKLFKTSIYSFIEKDNPDLFPEIRRVKDLSEENKQKLEESLKQYFEQSDS